MESWKAVFISVDRLVKLTCVFFIVILSLKIVLYAIFNYFDILESIETPWIVLANIGIFVFAVEFTCELIQIRLSNNRRNILHGFVILCMFVVYIYYYVL